MTTNLQALVEKWRQEAVKHPHSGLHAYNNCADELQAALDAQAGMVMVPVASTSAMDWAGVDAAEREHYIIPSEVAERIWDAMLAAAPAGPVSAQAGLECVGVKEMRQAVAAYMFSEGCTCCRDVDAHIRNESRLAELLNVPKLPDDSGFDFDQFRAAGPVEGGEGG